MADSDKNIIITPSTGSTSEPKIEFTGANNNPVTIYTMANGTLSFEGSAGQLFSVSDDLSDDIFTVGDMSGIPVVNAKSSGNLELNAYSGNLLIGTVLDNEIDKIQGFGGVSVYGNSGQLLNIDDTSEGDLFNVNDVSGVSVMKVDSNGAVGTPYTPMFSITHQNSGTVSTNTTKLTAWSTPLVDTANGWNSSTSQYVIPVSGYYFVSQDLTVFTTSSANNSRYVASRIYVDGAQVGELTAHGSHIWVSGSTYSHRGQSAIMYFNQGSTVDLRASNDNGTQTLYQAKTGFTLKYIG